MECNVSRTAIGRAGGSALIQWLGIALCLWLLQGCAGSPVQTREVLDEASGTTMLIVPQPLVFSRQRTDVAAYARDYVTIVAAEQDRSGHYSAWLIAHRWSTVDPRMEDGTESAGVLTIVADDREFTLTRADPPPDILNRRDLLLEPRAAGVHTAAYLTDDATLRYMAGAHRLILRTGRSTARPAYGLWQDGRQALQQLLERVPRHHR